MSKIIVHCPLVQALLRRIQRKMTRQHPTAPLELYPELAKYDEDQMYDMSRPLDDTPLELLNRYEITFEISEQSFYCFADAVSKDEALGQFYREHPNIPYVMITETLEV